MATKSVRSAQCACGYTGSSGFWGASTSPQGLSPRIAQSLTTYLLFYLHTGVFFNSRDGVGRCVSERKEKRKNTGGGGRTEAV